MDMGQKVYLLSICWCFGEGRGDNAAVFLVMLVMSLRHQIYIKIAEAKVSCMSVTHRSALHYIADRFIEFSITIKHIN